MLFSTRLGVRLAIGWSMGAIASAVGVYLSYLLDLPTGATIVATLGAGSSCSRACAGSCGRGRGAA